MNSAVPKAVVDGDAPPPTFDVLPLSAESRRAVDDLGYVHPTPVQRAVFEPAVRGRDLVVGRRRKLHACGAQQRARDHGRDD